MPSRTWAGLAALGMFVLAAAPAAAEDQLVDLYRKYEISASLTSVILNADIRVDASNGDYGTVVDAEDDLGLDKVKVQPRGALRWRPGRKHELEAGYQFARRNSDKTLERTIEFADTSFVAGLNTKGKMDTDLLFVNYRYAFIAKERTQAGAGVGLGALFFRTGIDALASPGSDEVTYSEESDITVPVGSLGLFGRFLMGTRWSSEVDLRYVGLAIERFHIRYWEGNGAVRYFFSHKLGAEAGYGFDAVKVDVDHRTTRSGGKGLAEGQIKFSLQNVRLGIVFYP